MYYNLHYNLTSAPKGSELSYSCKKGLTRPFNLLTPLPFLNLSIGLESMNVLNIMILSRAPTSFLRVIGLPPPTCMTLPFSNLLIVSCHMARPPIHSCLEITDHCFDAHHLVSGINFLKACLHDITTYRSLSFIIGHYRSAAQA